MVPIRPTQASYLTYVLSAIYISGGLTAIALSIIYRYNKVHFGVVFFIGGASAIWFLRHKSKSSDGIRITNSASARIGGPYLGKLAALGWWVLILVGISIRTSSTEMYSVPLNFFFAIGGAILMIMLQIASSDLSRRKNITIVLFQILTTSIVVGTSFLFLFPGPYGSDAPYHVWYIDSILSSGSFMKYSGQYENYPLYHILQATIIDMGGVSLKIGQMALAVAQVASSLFIFVIARRVFDARTALAATVVGSLSTGVITACYVYFPGDTSVILLLFAVYLVLKVAEKSRLTVLMPMVLVFFALLFFHPLAPVILGLFALIFASARKRLDLRNIRIPVYAFLCLALATLILWAQPIGKGQDLLSNLAVSLKQAFSHIDFSALQEATLASSYEYTEILMSDLGLTLLIFLAIVGSFFSISLVVQSADRPANKSNEVLLALSVTCLVIIPAPFVFALVYPQGLPNRIFPFMQMICSVFVGVVIVKLSLRSGRLVLVTPVLVTTILMLFMLITSPAVNPNSDIYSTRLAGRHALTYSETQAAFFIDELPSTLVYGSPLYLHSIDVSLVKSTDLNPDDPSTYAKGFLVVRSYDLAKGFLTQPKGKLAAIVYPNTQFYDQLNASSMILSNGQVRVFMP